MSVFDSALTLTFYAKGPLSPAWLDRGADIILRNPAYRRALYNQARERAEASGRGSLVLALIDAWDVLELHDLALEAA